MKLFTAIATAAAVLGTSLVAINPAEASTWKGLSLEAEKKYWAALIKDYYARQKLAGTTPATNYSPVMTASAPVEIASSAERCPSGTSYHKIRVGGLIKRTAAEGCFTDFQASQLRMQANANQQQRIRDFQRTLNESFPSPVNCYGTVNSWGGGYNTYDATCY